MKEARASVLALLIAVTVTITACAGSRNSLGTAAGACFRDLPAAKKTVHDKGRLVGVRLVSAETLLARLPRSTTAQSLPDQDLCVFAFSGTYQPGTVTGAPNTTTGHFALIAVGTKHPTVAAAYVVNQLPTRFRHLR